VLVIIVGAYPQWLVAIMVFPGAFDIHRRTRPGAAGPQAEQ